METLTPHGHKIPVKQNFILARDPLVESAGFFKSTGVAQSGIVDSFTNVLGVGKVPTEKKPVDPIMGVGEIKTQSTPEKKMAKNNSKYKYSTP